MSSEEIIISCDSCHKEFQSRPDLQSHFQNVHANLLSKAPENPEEIAKYLEERKKKHPSKARQEQTYLQKHSANDFPLQSTSGCSRTSKWCNDRIKNYPTAQHRLRKEERRKARHARGERLSNRKSRFNKYNTRLHLANMLPSQSKEDGIFKRPFSRPKRAKKLSVPNQNPQSSIIESKSDWNGDMNPFRGTKELYENEPEQANNDTNDFDDSEWSEESTSSPAQIKLNNSLGALMSNYGSDCSDEETNNETTNQSTATESFLMEDSPNSSRYGLENLVLSEETVDETMRESDNDPPIEMEICRSPVGPEMYENKEYQNTEAEAKAPMRRMRCTLRAPGSSEQEPESNKREFEDCFPYKNFKKRKATLLEMLLESEIRHERNMILQCVRYVVDNNFFLGE